MHSSKHMWCFIASKAGLWAGKSCNKVIGFSLNLKVLAFYKKYWKMMVHTWITVFKVVFASPFQPSISICMCLCYTVYCVNICICLCTYMHRTMKYILPFMSFGECLFKCSPPPLELYLWILCQICVCFLTESTFLCKDKWWIFM